MSRTASQLRTQARRLDRVYLQMANLVRIMRDEARSTCNSGRTALRPGRRWDCHGDEVPKPKPVCAILDIRAELLRRAAP
jgi:hypothetical protein